MKLRDSDRAVSSVVAVMILFGFLVIGLSLYQGVAVPAQNEEIEFRHNQQVQQDMLEVRNALLRTKVTGEDSYVTVELGTEYPARMFAINPPAATGTLRTTDPRSLRVHDEAGADVSTTVCPGVPETRFLEYRSGYHVYGNTPTIRYENSVIYKQFGTGNVTMSSQTLVQGNVINLIPLKAQYAESGVGAVTVEPRAGRLKTTTVTDPTVVVPTRLSERDWERMLAGQVAPENVSVSDGNLTVTPPGEYEVQCGPVAVDRLPPSGARGQGAVEINPVAPGDVRLTDSRIHGGSAKSTIVEIDLNNTAERDGIIERARISFLFDEKETGGGNTTEATIKNGTAVEDSALLPIKGEPRTLDPEIRLPGNDTVTTIQLDFDEEITASDFIIIDLTFENGQTGTYFIAPRKT